MICSEKEENECLFFINVAETRAEKRKRGLWRITEEFMEIDYSFFIHSSAEKSERSKHHDVTAGSNESDYSTA